MPNNSSQVESLFAAAAELFGESRKAFLDRECAGQEALRRQLEGLLQAHDRVNHPLDSPAVKHDGLEPTCLADAQAVGTIIAGRYKLLEQIGEGGMGTVWVAEQTEPVRRKVALKLIKAGMDSKSVLARFEAERQALALMDHPNIAKVLDGGMTDAGRPYFVMEYVKGVPITEYCDAVKLSVPERLNLFMQVCSAVQHAHQKGIIHRDLKPSNILVAPYDDKPVPKVIDFGLAKALHQRLTERTLHTAHETVIGTPLYMSPEQAQLNNLDVDTRSDIYSLGVLLYELLTGTTPLEKARFKEAAWDEIRRIIREEEPPRPSTRLSSTGTLPSLAACRQTEPVKLAQQLKGELDWIVMKALEKERTRRYETATGLAKDVQRFLAGEAVEACPPTLAYRLQKAYRKHRAAILTIGAFAGVLLISTVFSLTFGIRAQKAELKAREEAEAASFLLDTFLGTNDEHEFTVGNVPFTTVVDRAVKQLDRDTERMPLTVARIRARISRAYILLGKYPEARQQLEQALEVLERELGPNNLETLNCQESLVWARYAWDEKTESLLRDVLERRRAVQGSDHPDTLRTLLYVGWMRFKNQDMDNAERLYREALEIAVAAHGDDSVIAIDCKMRLASHIARKGEYDECTQLAQEAIESGQRILDKEDPFLLYLRYGANKYAKRATGTSEDNRRVAEQDVALLPEFLEIFGEDHPRTLILLDDITLHYTQGKWFDKADTYSKTLLEKRTQLFERDDYGRVRALWLRGLALLGLGKVAEAKPLFEEAIPLAGHKGVTLMEGTTLVGLGKCLLLEENYAEAETKLASGYEIIRSYFKDEGFSANRMNHVREVLDDLVAVSEKLGKSEAAEHWRKEREQLEQLSK